MAENSPIEWTDHTWSPWEGCQKVGPGCDHCYAESMNRWLRKGENWGPGAPRREYSEEHWAKPLKWNDAAGKAGSRVKVFPSVCDPFDKDAPDGARTRFALLIRATPQIIWLLLTKRIGNAAAMLAEMFPDGVPPNVWIGATVVNQEEADRDIPKLLATPARVRFLSCEPLLGPVDLCAIEAPDKVPGERWTFNALTTGDYYTLREDDGSIATAGDGPDRTSAIDWVIVGGESGPGARPMHPEWARSLRDQCAAAGVPFLFKQWGEHAPSIPAHVDAEPSTYINHAGQRATEQAALADGGSWKGMYRVGKKAAGRLLDGVTHDGFPA